ncbi:UDP-N-acetylmuramoyl-L-alanine--D-glutamate ligase, partial [Candidatus Uhrbacteria bacterium]|nr:UDP-N-acetylmuramoyl-L-alanine--D-glutamate ligase [Candidatus Uhrbacteria bacterium]
KSTTSAMIAHILENNVKCQMSNVRCRIWLAGNIRTTPMLSIVDRVRPNDWVVLELSSWHLENMGEQRISPHVAVVTNLLQDHLNRYRSMGAYARAKENIVRYQRDGDIAVLNRENVWTKKMATRTAGRVCWFPIYRGPSSVLQRTVIRKFGAHYVANAHAAAVACHAIGVPIRIIRSSLRTFRGLPDRQESIRVVRGVTYVNDTTATTPDATIAALQRFSTQGTGDRVQRKIVLICGGTDKNLNYKPLIPWIKKTCKAVVLLPGAATEKMKIEIKKFRNDRSGKLRNYFPNFSVSQFPIIETSSMRSAVTVASKHAMRGNIILLSPAAASFGLFQHEFDRGEQFRTIVRRLT